MSKTIKSHAGTFELNTPRDRAGSFEPQLAKKHQTHLTDELERKIIALFALGNSYQDIRGHIQDLYGIALSNGTLKRRRVRFSRRESVTTSLESDIYSLRKHPEFYR